MALYRTVSFSMTLSDVWSQFGDPLSNFLVGPTSQYLWNRWSYTHLKFRRQIVFGKCYSLWMISYPQKRRGLDHVTHTIFQPVSRCISETMRHRAIYYGTLIRNHRRSIERCHSRWPWVMFGGHFCDPLSNFLAPLNSRPMDGKGFAGPILNWFLRPCMSSFRNAVTHFKSVFS